MNQLNDTLRCIRTTKAHLTQQLRNTNDEHQKQKLEHQIHCLNMEETHILNTIGEQ